MSQIKATILIYFRIKSISLGRDDLDKVEVPGSDVYKIEAIYIHPSYLPARHRYNDIALIKTDRKVQFNKNVFPMCLPKSDQVQNDFLLLQIAGWGQVNGCKYHGDAHFSTLFKYFFNNLFLVIMYLNNMKFHHS